jgi:hypothetical protein
MYKIDDIGENIYEVILEGYLRKGRKENGPRRKII